MCLHFHLWGMSQSLHSSFFTCLRKLNLQAARLAEDLAGREGRCALHFQGEALGLHVAFALSQRDQNHRVVLCIPNSRRMDRPWGICLRTHHLPLGRKGTELLFCAQITNEYFKEGAGLDLTKAVLK